MRINDIITGINGVQVGGVASAELPVGRRYHSLTFYYKGTANQATIEADIVYIHLKVNGLLIRDINVAELFKENAANGRAFVAGEIPIFFSEPWRASVMGEEATSFDLTNQQTFTVDVAIAGTAVAPAITGVSSFDYDQNVDQTGKPTLNIVKWIRQSMNANAGINNWKTLPKGTIQRVSFFSTAAIDPLWIQVRSNTVLNMSRTQIANLLAKYQITQQADTTLAYFDFTQQITDALVVNPLDDYNAQLTMAGAAAVNALSQVRVNRFG